MNAIIVAELVLRSPSFRRRFGCRDAIARGRSRRLGQSLDDEAGEAQE
jgi:hypothetical protein